jgi:Mce-associated membrane protein
MRAAVERHNDDGSIEVLVAVRVKVTNSEAADQEQGYRLRVQMAQDAGKYKIARLDQVGS